MSDWASLEDEMSDAVDGVFAEAFAFMPMVATPNVRAVPDPTRPAITIDGIFSARSRLAPAQAGGTRMTSFLSLSMDAPRLSIDLRNLPWSPRRQDQVRRVATGAIYEITDVDADGQGRVSMPLKSLTVGP